MPPQVIDGMRHSPVWPQLEALAPNNPVRLAVCGDQQVTNRLAAIDVPTLAIAGRDSPYSARHAAEAVTARIPGAVPGDRREPPGVRGRPRPGAHRLPARRRGACRPPSTADAPEPSRRPRPVTLRDGGLIGGIGLSSTTIDVLRRAFHAGIAGVQNAYSLIDRGDEDMRAAEGLAWGRTSRSEALTGMRKVVDDPVVREVAAELDVTPSPSVSCSTLPLRS